jgi:mRNA interferase MazF
MTPTMPFEFGDGVLVPFPFTSQAASKKRPAVVVSNRVYNTAKPDVVVMAITSQFRPSPALGEVWLGEWPAAGLIKPSAVKPVFATLERAIVIRQLGALSAGDRAALRKAIADTLGQPGDQSSCEASPDLPHSALRAWPASARPAAGGQGRRSRGVSERPTGRP